MISFQNFVKEIFGGNFSIPLDSINNLGHIERQYETAMTIKGNEKRKMKQMFDVKSNITFYGRSSTTSRNEVHDDYSGIHTRFLTDKGINVQVFRNEIGKHWHRMADEQIGRVPNTREVLNERYNMLEYRTLYDNHQRLMFALFNRYLFYSVCEQMEWEEKVFKIVPVSYARFEFDDEHTFRPTPHFRVSNSEEFIISYMDGETLADAYTPQVHAAANLPVSRNRVLMALRTTYRNGLIPENAEAQPRKVHFQWHRMKEFENQHVLINSDTMHNNTHLPIVTNMDLLVDSDMMIRRNACVRSEDNRDVGLDEEGEYIVSEGVTAHEVLLLHHIRRGYKRCSPFLIDAGLDHQPNSNVWHLVGADVCLADNISLMPKARDFLMLFEKLIHNNKTYNAGYMAVSLNVEILAQCTSENVEGLFYVFANREVLLPRFGSIRGIFSALTEAPGAMIESDAIRYFKNTTRYDTLIHNSLILNTFKNYGLALYHRDAARYRIEVLDINTMDMIKKHKTQTASVLAYLLNRQVETYWAVGIGVQTQFSMTRIIVDRMDTGFDTTHYNADGLMMTKDIMPPGQVFMLCLNSVVLDKTPLNLDGKVSFTIIQNERRVLHPYMSTDEAWRLSVLMRIFGYTPHFVSTYRFVHRTNFVGWRTEDAVVSHCFDAHDGITGHDERYWALDRFKRRADNKHRMDPTMALEYNMQTERSALLIYDKKGFEYEYAGEVRAQVITETYLKPKLEGKKIVQNVVPQFEGAGFRLRVADVVPNLSTASAPVAQVPDTTEATVPIEAVAQPEV